MPMVNEMLGISTRYVRWMSSTRKILKNTNLDEGPTKLRTNQFNSEK